MTAQGIYILDACALIAFLQEEPGAEVVEDLLEKPGNPCIVHAVNATEVQYDLILRGATEDASALEAQERGATLVTSDHREFDPIAEEGICRILFIR